jgi:NAD(P)-dependent dehydrogenase (short-subunit alcohol dehydrogenase family)
MRFQGQSALVTGAARGIGLATAKRFLDEGAEVLAVDVLPIPEARTKSLEMDLASEDGPRRDVRKPPAPSPSSSPKSREKQTTSAARIAASRRAAIILGDSRLAHAFENGLKLR